MGVRCGLENQVWTQEEQAPYGVRLRLKNTRVCLDVSGGVKIPNGEPSGSSTWKMNVWTCSSNQWGNAFWNQLFQVRGGNSFNYEFIWSLSVTHKFCMDACYAGSTCTHAGTAEMTTCSQKYNPNQFWH